MKAKETSVKSLKMALLNRPITPNKKLSYHSDREIQYACEEIVSKLNNHKSIVRSMNRKGNCWDNAVADSFFKTLKVELIYQNKYQTRQESEWSIFNTSKLFTTQKEVLM